MENSEYEAATKMTTLDLRNRGDVMVRLQYNHGQIQFSVSLFVDVNSNHIVVHRDDYVIFPPLQLMISWPSDQAKITNSSAINAVRNSRE